MVLAALLAGGCQTWPAVAADLASQSPEPRARLMVADFDHPGHLTNLGGPFGGWEADPNDPTQGCRIRLTETERLGTSGYGLMIDYDVDSPNPAYGGFWMKVPAIDLRGFTTLSIALKGDPQRGWTKRLALELKDRRHVARFVLDGIEAQWKRMQIPLSVFAAIKGIRRVDEVVLVFDDQTVTEKLGTLYVDEIVFE